MKVLYILGIGVSVGSRMGSAVNRSCSIENKYSSIISELLVVALYHRADTSLERRIGTDAGCPGCRRVKRKRSGHVCCEGHTQLELLEYYIHYYLYIITRNPDIPLVPSVASQYRNCGPKRVY